MPVTEGVDKLRETQDNGRLPLKFQTSSRDLSAKGRMLDCKKQLIVKNVARSSDFVGWLNLDLSKSGSFRSMINL